MKRFTLTPTNGHGMPGTTYKILIDDEDAHFLRTYAWKVLGPRGHYVHRWGGYGGSQLIQLHREIMRPHTSHRVYFVNGNHFDLRRENLSFRQPVDNALFRGFMQKVNRASNFSPALAS